MTHEAFESFRFVATREDQGKRLDQVLAAHVPGLSRRQARVLLDLGGVFVDRARTKVAGKLVREGQQIVANVGRSLERATKEVGAAARAKDEAALPPYGIQHEDDDILVVEKPAGLLTAPTPEGDRNTLAYQLGKRFGPVFVVHRLDLGTSGLLVFARTAEANRALSERFRTHDLDREYLAVLAGRLEQGAYTVTEPVQGKRALTHITVVERIGSVATVARCRLETGRTHQIRLHTMHLGHPVLGDARYGTRTPIEPPRMALHATTLGFIHPRTGLSVRFEAPLPSDLEAWVRTLGETPGAPLVTP